MIIDYFINFCDSGVCFNERHRCTYPVIKKAPIENIYNTEIDPTKKVTKVRIELEARDKFHVYYPENSKWHGKFYIANHCIHQFESECDSNMKYINLDFECPDIMQYIQEDANMECEIYINDDIVCPYGLDLLIYMED